MVIQYFYLCSYGIRTIIDGWPHLLAKGKIPTRPVVSKTSMKCFVPCVFATALAVVAVAHVDAQEQKASKSAETVTKAQAGGDFKVNMMGPHFGAITQGGKPVASIIPDPNSPSGEKVLGTTSSTPPPDALAFYESYKRRGAVPSNKGATAAPSLPLEFLHFSSCGGVN
jgi:hypothetical protein